MTSGAKALNDEQPYRSGKPLRHPKAKASEVLRFKALSRKS
jgi:hypothetical protein